MTLSSSAEEPDAHLLLDVCPLEDLLELVEGDEVVLVHVRLQYGPLGDRHQLLLANVGTYLWKRKSVVQSNLST